MATLMDPRVAAIMARFDPAEKKEEPEPKPEEKVKPPTNLEEFLKAEGLEDWPHRLTSEGPLDIQAEALLFGSQDDIANILRESAPLGVYMMDELDDRLDKLEDKLKFYASQIVTEEKREEKEEDIPYGVNRAFITELMGTDASKAHHSSKRKMLKQNETDFVESVMETRKKSLDYCQFPGFQQGELIELPGQMEAPPILHRVTKTQNFNPGFKKFWKKLFLSEASVAVMQDTFWWFFLNKYDAKSQDDKDLLYDRIADSFVGLFTSIHKDVKDKFLSVYPDCLAQAVYMAYWTAFPESRAKFDDNFKQDLVNCVYEWITGLKPVPGTAKNWKVKSMEAKDPKTFEREGNQAVASKMMQAAALNKDVSLSLDMESFNKVMASLGAEPTAPTPSFGGITPQNMSREVTKMTTMTNLTNLTNGLSVNSHGAPLRDAVSRPSPSRLATCGSVSRRKPQESHQIGPGPEYERVLFNTSGRSPLISHYLYMRSLRDFQQPGKKVRRTEISSMPAPGVTYKQLIQNRLAMSDALKKEYEKICDQTHRDIMDIERKRIETNREINNITRELMMTKNPLDIKILSERIMAIRGETDSKVSKRGGREKDREMSLLEKDTDHAQTGSDHHDSEDI